MIINPYLFGGAFTPLSIAGLKTYIVGNNADQINGGGAVFNDTVASIEDLTVNSFDATQSSGSFRPIFKGDHVLFNGSNDFLTMGTAISKMPTRTVFCVFEMVSSGLNQRIYSERDSGGSAAHSGLELIAFSSSGKYRSAYGDGVNYRFTDSSTSSSTSKMLFTEKFSTSSGFLTTMQIDGIDETETDAGFGGTATSIGGTAYNLSLGRTGEDTGGYANYKLYAFLVYDTELSDGDRTSVNNFLISEFGL